MKFTVRILTLAAVIGIAVANIGVEDRDSHSPTDAPSDRPSDRPSDAPSDVPSAAPTLIGATQEPTMIDSMPIDTQVPTSEADETPSPTSTKTATPTAAAVTSEPTVSPTPAETLAIDCDGSTEDLMMCFNDTLDGGDECNKCVATTIQNLEALGGTGDVNCGDYEAEVCASLSDCPCDGCLPNLQNFLNCNVGPDIGCTFDCLSPTSAPTPLVPTIAPSSGGATLAPTSCSDSTETLKTCFADELDGATECDMCIASALQFVGAVGGGPFNLTCSEYDTQVCAALSVCPCGTCSDDVQNYINCNVGPNIDCSLSCFDEPPSNATCPVTEDDITTCFAAEVFEPTCGSCLQGLAGNLSATAGINATDILAGGMGNITNIIGGTLGDLAADFNCSTYQESVCQVISACDCGTCFDDVGTLLDCSIGAATGCFLNCDGGATSAPSEAVVAVTEAPVASPSCAQIEADAIACLADAGDMGQECDSCVATNLPSNTNDCPTLQDGVCSAIDECPCGECSTLLEEYLSCNFVSQLQCEISC